MKITVVVGAFFPVPPIMGGAVEKAWFVLAQEFARRGHEVVQVSRLAPGLPREEVLAGVRHVRVPGFDTPRSLIWLKFLDLIYSLRARSILPDADIVVTNTFWLPILMPPARCGRIYVHVGRYPKWQMRLYGNASRLQAPSHAVERAIVSRVPELAKKVVVIPYPAPPTTNNAELPPIGDREKIILFVGRVHPEKGVHLLVTAFAARSRTVFANWKLMIVGPGEEKFGGGGASYLSSLKNSADEAGERVVFAGPIFDPAELEKTFRRARLFVYPSLAEQGESFGLAPLEAMTHGCAVLVSNLDCFHDFVREGETGFIFDHRSASAAETLGQKIDDIIVEETSLARVAHAGYRKSAEYSIDRVANRFLEDFESLLHNSHVRETNR